MVCFICKLCTEYIFFLIMTEQEKENSRNSQTVLLPLPAGDDIFLQTRCTKPVWISSVAGTQSGETENTAAKFSATSFLYFQQNTSAKTSFLRKVFTILKIQSRKIPRKLWAKKGIT